MLRRDLEPNNLDVFFELFEFAVSLHLVREAGATRSGTEDVPVLRILSATARAGGELDREWTWDGWG